MLTLLSYGYHLLSFVAQCSEVQDFSQVYNLNNFSQLLVKVFCVQRRAWNDICICRQYVSYLQTSNTEYARSTLCGAKTHKLVHLVSQISSR
ncbi:hypothetical protein EV361DRAFT_386699 [Lentinula raphanica]|nr:hypothetical protein EV361DRAFT_386699 [Lentinula raphanica]